MSRQLKIGISGTRGIPNRYGGFEQCAEYLALGLVAKGHQVYVYNSHSHEYQQDNWRGVHIIHCKDPEDKMGTFGQFIYDRNCFIDARKRNFDVLLQLGYTSSSIWYKLWPRDAVNLVNMDGLEWKRSKYNKYVQQFLKRAERWAAVNADALIADSIGIQQYLQDKYKLPSVFIPYGAEVFDSPDAGVLASYSLVPYSYSLLMARMEPENNIETIIKGYLQAGRQEPLVIIGKTDNKFGQYLVHTYGGNSSILFKGGIYDINIINNLRYYSWLYFHGHSVGGTNPSLLEAMASSALIAANDNVFNRTVLGEDAFYFTGPADIASVIHKLRGKQAYNRFIENNLEKIRSKYTWQGIVDAYEKVFLDTVENRH